MRVALHPQPGDSRRRTEVSTREGAGGDRGVLGEGGTGMSRPEYTNMNCQDAVDFFFIYSCYFLTFCFGICVFIAVLFWMYVRLSLSPSPPPPSSPSPPPPPPPPRDTLKVMGRCSFDTKGCALLTKTFLWCIFFRLFFPLIRK